jgi:hypothetical protein
MISVPIHKSFQGVQSFLTDALVGMGESVDVGEWQSIRDDTMPQAKTVELQNVVISYEIPTSVEALQGDIEPNLPFAEAQFLDRVSGKPLNPPPSDALWPWAAHLRSSKPQGQYSHTYPERFWPKYAGSWREIGSGDNYGIRYRYGDLQDVLSLLSKSPYTRQAYLPVWFPEDTGAVHGERVPCTLGYHFLLRKGHLDISYFIRSVDFFRHFPDDVYMACRLCQWVQAQLRGNGEPGGDELWGKVSPGTLTMHMTSLHVFEAERKRLERK